MILPHLPVSSGTLILRPSGAASDETKRSHGHTLSPWRSHGSGEFPASERRLVSAQVHKLHRRVGNREDREETREGLK